MGSDHIPLDEAARRSGLHPNTLRRLLRQGEIFGYKETERRVTRWKVSVSSLEQYADPIYGFLLELPGPKIFLTRRGEREDD